MMMPLAANAANPASNPKLRRVLTRRHAAAAMARSMPAVPASTTERKRSTAVAIRAGSYHPHHRNKAFESTTPVAARDRVSLK